MSLPPTSVAERSKRRRRNLAAMAHFAAVGTTAAAIGHSPWMLAVPIVASFVACATGRLREQLIASIMLCIPLLLATQLNRSGLFPEVNVLRIPCFAATAGLGVGWLLSAAFEAGLGIRLRKVLT